MTAGTVVFDIIGTCFSLEKPRQKLVAIGAPTHALELWFAQAIRDAFAFSHAGGYRPLKEILQAELPRTLKKLEIETNLEQRSQIMATFGELDLQMGAKEAFQIFADTGWNIVALTNGSEKATHQLLERAGVLNYFTKIYSCDAIAKTKPHPSVYQMLEANDLESVWLIAAHAWDIAGANLVGMKTAFVSQLEGKYLDIYPQPQIMVENLAEAARQIVNS